MLPTENLTANKIAKMQIKLILFLGKASLGIRADKIYQYFVK